MTLDPIVIILAGITVVFAGGGWAAAESLGRRQRGWRTPLGLAVVFGAAWGGLTLAESGMALAAGVLAAASLGITALRSGLPAWVAKTASRPAVHTLLVPLAGLALTAYGMYRIDADLQSNLDESAKLIAEASAVVDLGPNSAATARTDLGRPVPLWVPSAGTSDNFQVFSEADFYRRLRLEAQLIQTGPLDGEYNCHGWVFTGGKFWVRGDAVEMILMDNGYRETKRPTVGDVCVYRNLEGEVAHTAVVRGLGANGLILLESKWGRLGRYIHNADENHAYTAHKTTYYRTRRGTHLLAGIENVKPEMFTGAAEE